MSKENLLIELGTEELPPKSLKTLAISFKEAIEKEIIGAELSFDSVEWFAAPRRLAVRVNQLESQQATKQVEKRGPAVQAAFDANGEPTKAALGWARGNGIEVSEATRLKTDKGEWLLHVATVEGKSLAELVEGFINKAIKQLPIPKPMRWGCGKEEFIRPVHTLIALYGDQILPASILGLTSSNQSQGHRFHHRGLVEVSHADNYEQELEQAHVIVNYQQRQRMIANQIAEICQKDDAISVDDPDLLDEVTSLVEWPVALVGTFEERFLDVPPEALIYTMKDDQKYFPLLNKNNELLPKFIFISNIESKDPSQVI
ncbi:MAG: glycine--tRNA ligase subunit beta, partial [Gammaproteobacteria bacterium]|nr:glycine--tRNA ligase subunit beta [Gammaproteobacteria bacterium]